jgi:hypothetical protein
MEITAPQVQREPLDRLHAAFGGSIYLRHRAASSRSKPIYTWSLSGPTAVGLMMTLYTMMSPSRRTQIRTALDEWRTRPGTGANNRAKTACPRGHPYDTTWLVKGEPRRRCSICYKAWWAKNGAKYYERQKQRRLRIVS